MPKIVVENKKKGYLNSAIICTVLCLLPIGLIALFNIGNGSVWSAPYPQFLLYFLILHTVYAFGIGYAGQFNKLAYMIIGGITILGTLVLVIMGYAMSNPILMHLGASSLFLLICYIFGNYGGNGYFFRYSAPIVVVLVGLINILWFVGVGVSITAHIVIATIYDLIFAMMSFFRIKDDIKHGLSFIESKEFSYSEETEEEIKERKEAKRAKQKDNYSSYSSPNSEQLEAQRRSYNTRYGENSITLIKRSQMQHLIQRVEDKANSALDDLNSIIRINNSFINSTDSYIEAKELDDNNKLIWKRIRQLKKTVKETNKYLLKIANREFSINDCGKKFIFYLANGRCKVEKYNGDDPMKIHIRGFNQKFYYNDNCYALLTVDGYDEYFLEKYK